MTGKIKTLSDLNEGDKAVILDIDVDSSTSRRLMDLGFIPGTEVRVVKKAPMGDPTTYEIRGYQMGLRSSESSLISVN